jgi:hypothetical protein
MNFLCHKLYLLSLVVFEVASDYLRVLSFVILSCFVPCFLLSQLSYQVFPYIKVMLFLGCLIVALNFCCVVAVMCVTSCLWGHDWHFSSAVVDGARFSIAC